MNQNLQNLYSEEIIEGSMCSQCGSRFKKSKNSEIFKHGYPVICWDCWDVLNEKVIIINNYRRAEVETSYSIKRKNTKEKAPFTYYKIHNSEPLKYRAWHIKDKFMFDVKGLDARLITNSLKEFMKMKGEEVRGWLRNEQKYYMNHSNIKVPKNIDIPGIYFYGKELEILLCTALRDKNGEEVYESHLLKTSDSKIWVVKLGKWIHKKIEYYDFFKERKGTQLPISKTDEIVGNKYEHSELLAKHK